MSSSKLDGIIEVLWCLEVSPGHPGHDISYFNNQGWLGDKIERVSKQEHASGKWPEHDEFKVVFKECIDMDKLKTACKTRCSYNNLNFFENETGLCVNHDDHLKPIAMVTNKYDYRTSKKLGMVRFYGKEKRTALEIINGYLTEIQKC